MLKIRPNILLITSDEHKFDAVSCNGNEHIQTPNLDLLAESGINFKNHTCSSPICTPARASILTGQYPRTHGAWHVGYTLDKDIDGLAHWLSDENYDCGLFGKAHFEPELSNFAVNMDHNKSYYGFDEFHITEDNPKGEYLEWIREYHPEYLDKIDKTFHEDMQDNPIPMSESKKFEAVYTSPVPEEIHQTSWIADKTIDFIKENKDNQFFAWCSFVDPHHPWIPPEPFASLYNPEDMPSPNMKEGETEGISKSYFYPENMPEKEYKRMCAAYYGMISHIDHHIGRIIDVLKEKNLYDNTIIIYTSDHGDYNGDHGLIRKNAWMFDSILRVPLIIKTTGDNDKNDIYKGNTQHQDIAPTLLDLLNITVQEKIQGKSFAGIFDKIQKEGEREYSYFDRMGLVGIQKGYIKLLYYPKRLWPGKLYVNNDEFKLLNYPYQTDGFVLTNLKEDPLEYNNLSGNPAYSDIEKELKNKLFKWMLNTPHYYPPKEYMW